MARKKRKNVDYFPHLAHQKKPLRIINKKYGNDGYAFYFKLRELLAKTDYHNYDLSNDIDWQDFVSEMDIDEKKAVELIEFMVRLKELDEDMWKNEKRLWSENLNDDLQQVYNKRKSSPHKYSFRDGYDVLSADINVLEEGGTQRKGKKSKAKKRKVNGEYDIDGLIITDNGKHKRNTSGNPKYSFAFKNLLEDQIVETEVIDVEWNISKDGLIKPRVNVKSVVIDGVSVNYVTGHNAKNINDNGIGKGAKIKLTRAGEVIPYILEVIKKVKPSEPNVKFKWNSSKVDYIIDEKNNKEVNKKLLINHLHLFLLTYLHYLYHYLLIYLLNSHLN